MTRFGSYPLAATPPLVRRLRTVPTPPADVIPVRVAGSAAEEVVLLSEPGAAPDPSVPDVVARLARLRLKVAGNLPVNDLAEATPEQQLLYEISGHLVSLGVALGIEDQVLAEFDRIAVRFTVE